MRNQFKIFDIDRHVLEPAAMWLEYLPSSMKEWAPRWQPWTQQPDSLTARLGRLGDLALLPTPAIPAVRGQPVYRGMTERAYVELGATAALRQAQLQASSSGTGQLANMDQLGVDVAMLLPTYASYLVHNDEIESDVSRAYAAAYNRWMNDLRRADPERLKVAILISCHAPERMVADLEQALAYEPSAVVLRPNPIRGRTLAHPSYRPFWGACEAQSLTVLLHEGTHARVATVGADRFESRFGQHACSHLMEAMLALLSLIEGGVLAGHPRLRVALLEAGSGWLPHWLWRLDELEYRTLRSEVAERVLKPPSEYFRSQCWAAVEPGEALLNVTAQHLGSDRLLFGSDFPHLDHESDPLAQLLTDSKLGREDLARLFWDNPRRLLGL